MVLAARHRPGRQERYWIDHGFLVVGSADTTGAALTSLTEGRQAINAMPVLSGFDVEVRACAKLATARPI
jgi:hypothetical protein